MLRASTFASSSAIATSAAWPSTLGAVKLALSEPSLLTAQPPIRAMTSLPSATASDSRLRSSTAAPSLKTVPLAHEIGRAHVCTPVTNAQLVCRLLLAKKKHIKQIYHL